MEHECKLSPDLLAPLQELTFVDFVNLCNLTEVLVKEHGRAFPTQHWKCFYIFIPKCFYTGKKYNNGAILRRPNFDSVLVFCRKGTTARLS